MYTHLLHNVYRSKIGNYASKSEGLNMLMQTMACLERESYTWLDHAQRRHVIQQIDTDEESIYGMILWVQ